MNATATAEVWLVPVVDVNWLVFAPFDPGRQHRIDPPKVEQSIVTTGWLDLTEQKLRGAPGCVITEHQPPTVLEPTEHAEDPCPLSEQSRRLPVPMAEQEANSCDNWLSTLQNELMSPCAGGSVEHAALCAKRAEQN